MKTLIKLAVPTLFIFVVLLPNFAQAQAAPAAAPKNLLAGVSGPLNNSTSWSNYSSLSLIPGAGQFGVVSPNTTLYIGFTGGTTADISNMVIYKTARGGSKITSVTPVKLGGISNPSINLTSTTVCPSQPVSNVNPCVVRLDPTVLALSPLSDYYFVIYFTADSNNAAINAPWPATPKTSLGGWYASGDQSHLTVGQSIPVGNGGGGPYFLLYVMSN